MNINYIFMNRIKISRNSNEDLWHMRFVTWEIRWYLAICCVIQTHFDFDVTIRKMTRAFFACVLKQNTPDIMCKNIHLKSKLFLHSRLVNCLTISFIYILIKLEAAGILRDKCRYHMIFVIIMEFVCIIQGVPKKDILAPFI